VIVVRCDPAQALARERHRTRFVRVAGMHANPCAIHRPAGAAHPAAGARGAGAQAAGPQPR